MSKPVGGNSRVVGRALELLRPPPDERALWVHLVEEALETIRKQRNAFELHRMFHEKEARAKTEKFRAHLEAARAMIDGADPAPGELDTRRLPKPLRMMLLASDFYPAMIETIRACDLVYEAETGGPKRNIIMKKVAAVQAGVLLTARGERLGTSEKSAWCSLAAVLFDPDAKASDMRHACREIDKEYEFERR